MNFIVKTIMYVALLFTYILALPRPHRFKSFIKIYFHEKKKKKKEKKKSNDMYTIFLPHIHNKF